MSDATAAVASSPPRRTTPAADGLVVVDKPAGWTSHDVVGRLRRLAGTRKVGHAGTLDPMATGVLVVGIGRATRLLGHLALSDKEYDATIRLGQATVTDDAEGEVVAATAVDAVDPATLAAAVADLTGDIAQRPSAVSAVKVDGKRAYARVRAGEDVALAARPVTVHVFEVGAVRPTVAGDGTPVVDVDVHVRCSTGTYVRALARDLGAALGVGGHLTALRRTRVGAYDLATARTLEQLADDLALVPLGSALVTAFPAARLGAEDAGRVRHGVPIACPAGLEAATGPLGLVAEDGAPLALAERTGARLRYLAVLA